jgi:hypothetical protein
MRLLPGQFLPEDCIWSAIQDFCQGPGGPGKLTRVPHRLNLVSVNLKLATYAEAYFAVCI